ncbi:flavin-binding protein [Erythrobacter litoralis]|nr:flavin-binding protein [Erythrobacter litoralis]
MHTPVLATADADVRVLVLRGFDADSWTLRFHTDSRSPKVDAIAADPRVGVLAYDAEAKVQLRLRGTGRVERDTELADSAWSESTEFARRCYLGAAPGETRDGPNSGLPNWAEGEQPTEEQLAPVRANFAVLLVKVEEIDWYWLSNDGHRRALVRRDGGRWLTP